MVRLFILILVFTSGVTYAYFGEAKGYYQYFTPKEEEKYPRPTVPDDATLMAMPAQDFQALVTDTLNYALTVRNLDTYGDYARIQSVAFKRTEEFASLQVLYAQLHPPADENIFNRTLNDSRLERTIYDYLGNNRSEYGLIYFYSPTCSYCRQQEPLLERFQERHGWEIEPVDITTNPGLAAHFQIEVTPSLRLVDRNRNVMPLSNGLITLPELEERAYRFIRYLHGETVDINFRNILD